MKKYLRLIAPQTIKGAFPLPTSKSEANRALIIQALSKGRVTLHNLSEAKDTQVLTACLASDAETIDVGDAGTAMRFLTAFLAFQPQDRILTGSSRMQQRPIRLLVDALRTLGGEIDYLGQEGYPPMYIFGKNARFKSSKVQIPGDVSSQYISALLMVAPTLPNGLEIELMGKVLSVPYIKMTLGLMAQFGIQHEWKDNLISVPKQAYSGGEFTVESDWSAASYAFSIAGLCPGSQITLNDLKQISSQGDQAISELLAPLGVNTQFESGKVQVTEIPVSTTGHPVSLDFTNCPDLAQTVLPYLGARNIPATITGLDNLSIKETDRVAALQTELAKFGVLLEEIQPGTFSLSGTFLPKPVRISTYGDHRMAMGFAPLALATGSLEIEDPDVVEKSFPSFWQSMADLGFRMEVFEEKS